MTNLCLQHNSAKIGSLCKTKQKIKESYWSWDELPERAKGMWLYSTLVVDGDMIYTFCSGREMVTCHRVLWCKHPFVRYFWLCVHPCKVATRQHRSCLFVFFLFQTYLTFSITTVWNKQVDYWENVKNNTSLLLSAFKIGCTVLSCFFYIKPLFDFITKKIKRDVVKTDFFFLISNERVKAVSECSICAP